MDASAKKASASPRAFARLLDEDAADCVVVIALHGCFEQSAYYKGRPDARTRAALRGVVSFLTASRETAPLAARWLPRLRAASGAGVLLAAAARAGDLPNVDACRSSSLRLWQATLGALGLGKKQVFCAGSCCRDTRVREVQRLSCRLQATAAVGGRVARDRLTLRVAPLGRSCAALADLPGVNGYFFVSVSGAAEATRCWALVALQGAVVARQEIEPHWDGGEVFVCDAAHWVLYRKHRLCLFALEDGHLTTVQLPLGSDRATHRTPVDAVYVARTGRFYLLYRRGWLFSEDASFQATCVVEIDLRRVEHDPAPNFVARRICCNLVPMGIFVAADGGVTVAGLRFNRSGADLESKRLVEADGALVLLPLNRSGRERAPRPRRSTVSCSEAPMRVVGARCDAGVLCLMLYNTRSYRSAHIVLASSTGTSTVCHLDVLPKLSDAWDVRMQCSPCGHVVALSYRNRDEW